MSLKQVILKKRQSGPAHGMHPWLRGSRIERIEEGLDAGDLADVLDGESGRFIAKGFFNPKSRLWLRLLTWNENEAVDSDFFRSKLKSAFNLREQLGLSDQKRAARLFFSESDGLSGLTIDRYGDALSIQITSLGIYKRWEVLKPQILELTGVKKYFVKTDKNLLEDEGMPEFLDSNFDGKVEFKEGDIQFSLDLNESQKTGFYLDQAENRLFVKNLSQGRRVLDLYSYTGAFALQAASGGATRVLGVDSSQPAIEAAKRQALQNGQQVEFLRSDVFEFLKSSQEKFDLIVLDPPKFATRRDAKREALRMYFSINERALRLLEPGGIFVTCSCSGNISRDEFLGMLSSVARRAKRFVRVISFRGAAPDHPVSISCPETEYLKTIVAYVD